jgi:hypothetical protein
VFFDSALHECCLGNLDECRAFGDQYRLRIPVLLPALYLNPKQKYYKDPSCSLPARLYYNPYRLSLGKEKVEAQEIFEDHHSLHSVVSLACLKGSGALQVLCMNHMDAALVTSHFLNPDINDAIKYSLLQATKNDYVLNLRQLDIPLEQVNSLLRACRVYKLSGDSGKWKIAEFVRDLDMPEYKEYEWEQLKFSEGDNILLQGHCTFISFTLSEEIVVMPQVLLESSYSISRTAEEKWADQSFDCDPVSTLDYFGKPSELTPLLKECVIGNGPSCKKSKQSFASLLPLIKPVKPAVQKKIFGKPSREMLFQRALRASKTLSAIERLEDMGEFSSHIKRYKIDDKRTMLSVNFSCIIKNDD